MESENVTNMNKPNDVISMSVGFTADITTSMRVSYNLKFFTLPSHVRILQV